MSEPKQGEIWRVKLCGIDTVTTVTVVDVSDKTVAVRSVYIGANYFPSRYKRTDVEFIERA